MLIHEGKPIGLTNYGKLIVRNIRADNGHPGGRTHIDVEYRDPSSQKVIFKESLDQDREFETYEDAVNAVLIQSEHFIPTVGARYWLSPDDIFPHRVFIILKKYTDAELQTPLTILSRAVLIEIMRRIKPGKGITDKDYENIVDEQIGVCKKEERVQKTALTVEFKTIFEAFPFYFYVPLEPRGVNWKLTGYTTNGAGVKLDPVTLVYESKKGEGNVRLPQNNELNEI